MNEAGFQLSGQKYYKCFWDITVAMVKDFKVNMFKIDGVNFNGGGAGYSAEVEAMMRLLQQLRKVGNTWPLVYSLFQLDM